MVLAETAVVALLFTDVVDSTQLNQRLGDERSALLWAEHDRLARELLSARRGREIDHTDGFFLIFEQLADAADFALAYHRSMATLGLTARVGIHHGAVTLRPNPAEAVAQGAKPIEVEGLAKPFAARVMSLAGGGQTLLSAAARGALAEAANAAGEFESHGHYRLKGVDEPVEIFEIGTAGNAFMPPADSEKAYRVVRVDQHWQTLHAVRHNLAPERDRFIGRGASLRELARIFDAGTRLLTVVGAGGMGKTRVARRYGRTWLGDWPGGVYFCDLSEARSLEGIQLAMAVALEVALGSGDSGVQLGHAIAGRGRCLVILDNFEQVLEHGAASVGRWLDRATGASFLVTSRERLHLPGEQVFPIEPLELADEAIELFADRARAQCPGFELNTASRDAVAEIVRLLDGLPLAIELAAARVRVLSPAQILERLAHRFRLLVGARGAAARQATLRAAIDWSWDLLAPWEQSALGQSSVFEGGFTMLAAEAVIDLRGWPEAPEVMDVVQSLVDKSLLRAWVPAQQQRFDIDEPYFGMYLSIHEYAAEKLAADGTAAERDVPQAHGRYFARFGSEDAIQALSTHGSVPRRRALAIELDNLVAACRRAVTRNDGDTAVATYRATWEVLALQGPISVAADLGARVMAIEGMAAPLRAMACLVNGQRARRTGRLDEAQTWLEQALELAEANHDRCLQARVRANLGIMQRHRGQMDAALAQLNAALAIARELGDRRTESVSLSGLASVRSELGRIEEGRALLEEALAIDREVGDRSNEAITLSALASVHKEQGRFEQALELQQLALAACREVGNRGVEGYILGNMGNAQMELGQLEQSRLNQEAALAIHREVGNRLPECFVLCSLGNVLRNQGQLERALACYESALAIAREIGNPLGEGYTLFNLGDLRARQGRLDEAVSCCRQGVALLHQVHNKHTEGSARGVLADVLMRGGRLGEARAELQAGEALQRETGDRPGLAVLLCIRGRLDHLEGDLDSAQAALAEAEAIAEQVGAGPLSEVGTAVPALRALLAGATQANRTGGER